MNSFELNKVFGAVVLALLVGWLSGFAAEKVVAPEHLKENVYKVEGVVAASSSTPAAAPAEAADIKPLLAAADVAKGESLTKACAACHSFTKGGPNKVGPNLWGIVGNHHAHLGDAFAYSAAMKAASAQKWDYDALNKFLFNPKTALPGTKMAYAGIKKDEDRAAVIAYLRTLADSPEALP